MSSTSDQANSPQDKPEKISFDWIDYLKVFYSWLFAFKKTFSIEPGLYYTGADYDINTPLLVTSNYHMTVFILWRILRKRNVRLLIIDTEGINVWCSSGKGQFSTFEIMKQIFRYNINIISEKLPIELVLPKLSLSGINLAELRKNHIKPIIGPILAENIPEFLDKLPLTNCTKDRYVFGLKQRLFTMGPSLVQFFKYALFAAIILIIPDSIYHTGVYWQAIPIFIGYGALYILLFPLLPTRYFVIKGISLYTIIATIYLLLNLRTLNTDIKTTAFYLCFTAGTSLFFALYYTGNSGVSNYSQVKKEIKIFLPISAILFFASIAILIWKGISI